MRRNYGIAGRTNPAPLDFRPDAFVQNKAEVLAKTLLVAVCLLIGGAVLIYGAFAFGAHGAVLQLAKGS